MTYGEAIARVKAQGGFDVNDDDAGSWLLDAYRTMVARAKWRQLLRNLGPTVADQGTYALPDDVVDVLQLGIGGSPYVRESIAVVAELKVGWRVTAGQGIFAPAFLENETGNAEAIELYPAPSEAGVEITALCAVLPPTPTSGEGFRVPEDFHERIVDGAIATGLRRGDERSDLAEPFQAQFNEAVEALRRRRNSRVGSGPIQAAVSF